MYKNNSSLEMLKPIAEHQLTAKEDNNPKKIIDTCYLLEPFVHNNPNLRQLAKSLVLKANVASKKKDSECNYTVHLLIWRQVVKFFVKVRDDWRPDIAVYHLKKMMQKKNTEKDEKTIQDCIEEMMRLGVPKVPFVS